MRKSGIGLMSVGLLAGTLVAAPPTLRAQETGQRDDAFAEATRPELKPVRLYVENSNWLDVEVYAVRGSTRIRIGTVRSQEGRFFDIPLRAMEAGQRVRLMADPVGSSRGLTTDAVMINPGDIVEWRLRNTLSQSSLSVWST